MPKIWTVYDNYNCKELGAFKYEEQALKAKMDYVEAHEDEIDEDDILIDAFTLYE